MPVKGCHLVYKSQSGMDNKINRFNVDGKGDIILMKNWELIFMVKSIVPSSYHFMMGCEGLRSGGGHLVANNHPGLPSLPRAKNMFVNFRTL